MRTTELAVDTAGQTVVDLTARVAGFLREAGGGDGLLHVFVPHATAGLVLIELGAGSDADLLAALGDLLPADDRWRQEVPECGEQVSVTARTELDQHDPGGGVRDRKSVV